MAIAKKTNKVIKKAKKHGAKAGQKSLVRTSNKKAVKNGKQLFKQPIVKKVAKAVKEVTPVKAAEVFEEADFIDEEFELSENDEYTDSTEEGCAVSEDDEDSMKGYNDYEDTEVDNYPKET